MNLKPFLSWCSQQGIQSPLQIRIRDDGYRYTVWNEGNNSNRPFHQDNQSSMVNILHCPLNACITAHSKEELADRLLFERQSLGDQSKFAPYLAVLPTLEQFQNSMPRFWSQEALEQVTDGGWLQQAIKQSQSEIDDTSSAWANAVVDSRANFLPDQSYALTPFLDMINHDPSVKTKARVGATNDLCLDIASNNSAIQCDGATETEICISYGELTNLETFVNYGFVSQNNAYNTESFWISMLHHPRIAATVLPIGTIDPLTLSSLRRRLAIPQESTGKGPLVSFISKRNEVEVYALIAGELEENLNEARNGADRATNRIVLRYLEDRSATLQRGLDRIRRSYPEVFG